MDIESKRFRIRSTDGAQVEIWDKRTNRARYVPRSALPNIGPLAAMTEAAFDRAIEEA